MLVRLFEGGNKAVEQPVEITVRLPVHLNFSDGVNDGGMVFSIILKPEKMSKILSQPVLFDDNLDSAIPRFRDIIGRFYHRVFLAVRGDGDLLLGHSLLDEQAAYGSRPLL